MTSATSSLPSNVTQSLTPQGQNLTPSSIFRVAREVVTLREQGRNIINLTAGDFAPAHFSPPEELLQAMHEAVDQRQTFYPPLDGLPETREGIAALYRRCLDWDVDPSRIIMCSGGRPGIFATTIGTLSTEDTFVYAAPSYNNQYYAAATGAREVVLPTSPEAGFTPNLDALSEHLTKARIVHLNSPVNPTGTVLPEEEMQGICEAVVRENHQRIQDGRAPVLLLFDMVYWPLTFGDVRFRHPVHVCPEIEPWVISVDTVSKWLTGPGLRVGWVVSPPGLETYFKGAFDHMGAWPPRPEQWAVARMLEQPQALDKHLDTLRGRLENRLMIAYEGFEEARRRGLPVSAIKPQGALYLSAQINLEGKSLPDGGDGGKGADVQRWLLHDHGIALVPFRDFGLKGFPSWFRLSVGAASTEELKDGVERIAHIIQAL